MRERHLVRIPAVIALTAIILAVTSMSGCTTKQPAPEITNVQLLVGPSTVPVKENSTFAAVVTVTGGTAPFSYAYAGTPTWHSTGSSATEELSWPTPGKHYITCAVTVTDANGKTGSATTMLEVTVTAPPVFIQKDLPDITEAGTLPDITKETMVPVILLANKDVLLTAWQPEAATFDMGSRTPIATLSTSFRGASFAQVMGTGVLVWQGGAQENADNNAIEYSTGLTSYNHRVLTPITTRIETALSPVPYAEWWSGIGATMITASIPGETSATSPPLVGTPSQLIAKDSTNHVLSVDLPHDLAAAGILVARGDLQDGFVLIQWQARGESVDQQAEHLLLVRLRKGKVSTHNVTRDDHFNQKDASTWIQKPLGVDRGNSCARVGQNLYIMPSGYHEGGEHVWTLDLDASSPIVRLDQKLTDFANGLPADNPGWASFYLAASGPYLMFVMPRGVRVTPNAWAIRDGKVVGHLSMKDGALRASAGTLSASQSIKGLTEMLLPNQQAMSPF
jgi:hypothetical protein